MKNLTVNSAILLLGALVFVTCGSKEEPATGVDLSSIPYDPTEWSVTLPEGWPDMIIPEDNPMTEEGIDLGRHLFYDPILSADNTMSCSSCHLPTGAFTDNQAFSKGIDGIASKRSSMSLVNIGLARPIDNEEFGFLFWDGRSKSLEEQALEPIEDPIELHNEWPTVVKDLQESEMYRTKFREAFGIANSDDITKELAAKAIAQFERSLLSYNSKYDKIVSGQWPYSEEELDGFNRFIDSELTPFNKQMECAHCHTLPLTTSHEFANNALQPAQTLDDFDDLGRGAVVNNPGKNGFFRIPTLRNVMHSAPYMHDGSLATIDDVLDHYFSGGHFSPNANADVRSAAADGQKNFTEYDRVAIKAFLETFTDTTFLKNPAIQDPFQ